MRPFNRGWPLNGGPFNGGSTVFPLRFIANYIGYMLTGNRMTEKAH